MGDNVMKLAHTKTLLGIVRAVISTTTGGDQGQRILETVKAGNPFWAWDSIPSGYSLLSSIDFSFGTGFSWGDGAPLCADNAAANNLILAELAEFGPSPEQVLTKRL